MTDVLKEAGKVEQLVAQREDLKAVL